MILIAYENQLLQKVRLCEYIAIQLSIYFQNCYSNTKLKYLYIQYNIISLNIIDVCYDICMSIVT